LPPPGRCRDRQAPPSGCSLCRGNRTTGHGQSGALAANEQMSRRLTCDRLVTYSPGMDAVFKALADRTRRSLLDELFARDGQTLTELEERLPMTRFGVMKHLKVLEEAGLVTTQRRGREKLHYLNPVPIRLIHDRWVSKYAEPLAATISGIKHKLEEESWTSTR
jgi:DNA-binding transcriptional ArsR family regulator